MVLAALEQQAKAQMEEQVVVHEVAVAEAQGLLELQVDLVVQV
jgi:hypothetical protein